MHNLPRQKLAELIAQYGHGLCDDAKRLEGMLKDVLRNEHKRETFVLVSALREGIADKLRSSASTMPPEVLATKLVRQLRDNLGLDESVAQWGVESWAIALNIPLELTEHHSRFSDNVVTAAKNCLWEIHARLFPFRKWRHLLTVCFVTSAFISTLLFTPRLLMWLRTPTNSSIAKKPLAAVVEATKIPNPTLNSVLDDVAPTVAPQTDPKQPESVSTRPDQFEKPTPSKKSKELAEKYRTQGQMRFDRGDYRGAIEQFSLAILLDESENSYGDRAVANLFAHENAAAVEDSTKVIETNPNNAAAFFLRYLSFQRLQQFSEAAEDLRRATEIDPMISQKRASWQTK